MKGSVARREVAEVGRDAPAPGALRSAFAGLEQLQRSALELAHGDGMAVDEIAGALGRPAAEIRLAMREGLLRLGAVRREALQRRSG